MSIDREAVLEAVRKESGVDDFIPLTLRFHTSFYNKLTKFCDATGIKKAVLVRKLCEIGWELVVETEQNGEET